jgi:Rrf2 family transcriptional regulator, nitric oxide-sensitive transcriptional repressor
MLSKTTDYALRAVACLAGRSSDFSLRDTMIATGFNGQSLTGQSNSANGTYLTENLASKKLGAVASLRLPMSADVLAEVTKVPRRYLHRVLQDLIAAEILSSRSGPGGGYELARAASDLTILDVINAVAPFERIRTCPLGLTSHANLCRLHEELDRVYEATESAFRGITIQQLLDASPNVVPLCSPDA